MLKHLTLLSFLIWNSVTAQTDTTGPYRFHEIGLNMSSLFNILINGNQGTVVNPYLITYKYVGNHNVIRTGFGLKSNRLTSDNDTLHNFTIKNSSFDGRLGYEYQVTIYKRWRAGFGVDVLYNHSASTQRSLTALDIVHEDTKSFSIGEGFVITAQFEVNRRILLSTETSLYFHYKEETVSETFDQFPDFNTSQTSVSNWTEILPPTALYLVIRL